MGLKAIEEQRLEGVGLIKFFTDNRAHYKAMAQDAYDYTAKILEPTGLPVRPDDVAGHLRAALEIDKPLTDARDTCRATQNLFVGFFTNLVLERLWSEVSHG
jgi:hypothetical protein